ncbi:MAG: glycosyltransferase family 2 protein, partial [Candidatus Zixiibacteriota bacterium]
VLSIDADEVVSSRLAEEIRSACNVESGIAGFFMPRLTNFFGRWIRHSQWYPDYVLRLFRRKRGGFSPALVHESTAVDGQTGRLSNPLLHYSYPNLQSYFDKTERYSALGARQMHEQGKRIDRTALIYRPIATFYRHFIFHLGFLDGWEGFFIALLSSHRNFAKYAKLRSLARTGKP